MIVADLPHFTSALPEMCCDSTGTFQDPARGSLKRDRERQQYEDDGNDRQQRRVTQESGTGV
jgi:hypothetical protein